jgi:hypothetical protein
MQPEWNGNVLTHLVALRYASRVEVRRIYEQMTLVAFGNIDNDHINFK